MMAPQLLLRVPLDIITAILLSALEVSPPNNIATVFTLSTIMKKSDLLSSLVLLVAVVATSASAKQPVALRTPAPGVLCDHYMCANNKGMSRDLTAKYLGAKAANGDAFTSSGVDLTEFTFANGIFCDTKEKLCRKNRYFGADGKHSGAVSAKYTKLLFGQ